MSEIIECNHVESRGNKRKDDATFYNIDSGTKTMSNRVAASLGSMRYFKSTDAIRHARRGCTTEQHRRATG